MRPVTMAEIDQASQRWMTDPEIHLTRRVGPTSVESFRQIALKWFRFHDAICPPVTTTPFDRYLADFLRFSVSVQLSRGTILHNKSCVCLFLDWARCHHTDLSTVTLTDVETYVETKRQTGWKPRTVASQCSILRRFFRYALIRGWTSHRIAGGISRPRVSRYEEAPKGPAWRDVRKLLASNSGVSPSETRTRAMLFLNAYTEVFPGCRVV